MRSLIFFLNCFYIVLVLLWEPLHNTIITFDSKGRTVVFLSIILFLLNLISNKRFKRLLLSKPIVFWGIWIIYSSINLSIQGYDHELPFLFYIIINLFAPFLIMLIVAFEWHYQPKKIIFMLLFTFVSYGLFTLLLIDEFAGLTAEQNVGKLGNMGPLNTMFVIFYASLLFAHKWLKKQTLLLSIAFTFLIIVLIATRKAFGAALIMLIFLILSQVKLSFKSLALTIVLSLITIGSVNLALNNSTMGKRFESIEESGMKFNTTDNEVLNLLGDRAFFYITGTEIFLENPITGIGLNNFTNKSGTNYRIHSEYIVQITEGGIIGCLFFLLFYLSISRKLYQIWKTNRNTRTLTFVLIGGFSAILFVNITAWTYEFPHYFACFGVIIGYLKINKQ